MKNANISLENYSDLIKTVARVEYSRLSSSKHLLEFSELLNIGATTVYVVLSSQPESYHNSSYISTAIKWAIRNELRRRFKWYSNRQTSKEDDDEIEKEELREAVYETIISIDEMENSDNPIQVEDNNLNPEEKMELIELKKSVLKAMNYLPEKEKIILEAKFFKNKKVKEIADELGVSSSRISKLIQCALDKIKSQLEKEGII